MNINTQRGAGYWGIMAMLVCLILIGRIGMLTLPAYLENRTLEETITDKLAAGSKKTGEAIIKDIQKQMKINSTSVGDVSERIEVVTNTPGKVQLKTNYEIRGKLFGHIEIVNKFEKEFSR